MKNKIIIIFSILFAVAAFLLLPNNKKSENEVVFWTLQLGTFDKYINKVITDFEEQNPEIRIKWVDVPYSEGEKRTLAALLTDNPPDLINLTPDFSAMAARKNTLFEIPKEVMNIFPEDTLAAVSYNGKIFAIPFYLTSAVTYANSELMKKAGIETVPKNYRDMYLLAEKIKSKTGCYVDMPTVSENDTFWKILNKNQLDVMTDLQSNNAKQIFEEYKNLYQNNLIPKESITQSHREALEKYMSGQVVFLQAGANFLNIIKENAPLIYEKTIISEQLTGKTGKYDFSLMNLIIPKKSKNSDAALKFALFLTNEANQLEFAKLTSVLPANKFALKNEYFNSDLTKEDLARKISAKQINNLSSGIKNYRQKKNIITLLNTSIVKIMTNTANIDDELAELVKKIDKFDE